jgi:hypothetical protein
VPDHADVIERRYLLDLENRYETIHPVRLKSAL